MNTSEQSKPEQSKAKRIFEALGLRRSIVGMLSMVVLVGMGERMAERFLPLYLIALGSGILWPGFLNAIVNVVSALYSFPGGWLAERIGPKKSLLVFNLMSIGGFALVAAIPKWQTVILGSFLFSFMERHFASRHHGLGFKGIAQKETRYGRDSAFVGSPLSHGIGANYRRHLHR